MSPTFIVCSARPIAKHYSSISPAISYWRKYKIFVILSSLTSKWRSVAFLMHLSGWKWHSHWRIETGKSMVKKSEDVMLKLRTVCSDSDHIIINYDKRIVSSTSSSFGAEIIHVPVQFSDIYYDPVSDSSSFSSLLRLTKAPFQRSDSPLSRHHLVPPQFYASLDCHQSSDVATDLIPEPISYCVCEVPSPSDLRDFNYASTQWNCGAEVSTMTFLKNGVWFLTDIFQNCIDTCNSAYADNPSNSCSTHRFTGNANLKYKVKLDFITPDKLRLLFENIRRGGSLSVMGNHHLKRNDAKKFFGQVTIYMGEVFVNFY